MFKRWKKKYFFMGILIISLSLLFAACSSSGPSSEGNNTDNGVGDGGEGNSSSSKNVATFVLDNDPVNINYHAGDAALITMITHDWFALYNTETGEYEPRLLESWEHNEDYTEWTMKIRKGIKWHDGVEFTAHDMKFTNEYMHDPDLDIVATSSYGRDFETYEVIDDYTFKIITDEPNPNVISMWTMPMPKHIWEDVDPANFSKADEGYLTVGLGPYKMTEYKVGEYIKFEAFDEYYGGKPEIETIYYRIIGDKTAQIAALESGQIDVLTVDATAAEQILKNENLATWEGDSGNVAHLYMNNKREPFDDIRVRQAIAHLVNREPLVEQAMRGFAQPAYTSFAPTDFHFNPDVTEKYDFNVDKAIELLEEAGYSMGSDGIMEKDGEKLEFGVVPGFPEAETAILVLAQDFIKAGIKIEPRNLERNVITSLWDTHDYDMFISGMTMGPDPIRYRKIWDYKTEPNITQYESDVTSDLFAQVAATFDENEQKEIYEEIQRQVSLDVPSVTLWYRDTIYAYNEELDISDVKPIGMAHFRFLHMENLRFK